MYKHPSTEAEVNFPAHSKKMSEKAETFVSHQFWSLTTGSIVPIKGWTFASVVLSERFANIWMKENLHYQSMDSQCFKLWWGSSCICQSSWLMETGKRWDQQFCWPPGRDSPNREHMIEVLKMVGKMGTSCGSVIMGETMLAALLAKKHWDPTWTGPWAWLSGVLAGKTQAWLRRHHIHVAKQEPVNTV